VTTEKPEKFLPKLLSEESENSLVYQEEICSEERDVEESVEVAMKEKDASLNIHRVWGSTIYHIDDLSFDSSLLASTYTKFRSQSDGTQVRKLLPNPSKGSIPLPQKSSIFMQEALKFLPHLVENLGYT
jgi:deoxyribodipyrimidine photolyase